MEEGEKKIVIYWGIKKTISLICAVLIIPVFIVFLFSLTLKTTVINPDFYKANLKKTDTYNRLIQDGIPSLILKDSDQSNEFSKELIVFIIRKAINPLWVENLSGVIIDKTINFLSSEHETLNKVDINLSEVKKFQTKVSDGLIILSQLVPSCSQAQEGATSSICKTSGTNLNLVKKDIDNTRETVNKINLTTINIESGVSQANSYLGIIHKLISNINAYFWASLIVLFALFATIIVLQINNIPMMAKFISWPLIAGSLFGLLVALVTQSFSPKDFDLVNLNLTTEMLSIIADFIKTNTFGVLHRMEIVSAVVLGIFIIKLCAVRVLEKRNFKFFGRVG